MGRDVNFVKITYVVVVSLLVGSVSAQEAATLRPASDQSLAAWPYRTAELHLHERGSLSSRVSAVGLRWQLGGPTFIHPITVVQNVPLTLRVSLPAIQVQQVYNIDLLAGPDAQADVLSSTQATIVWPDELVNPGAFIDPITYGSYVAPLPSWPRRTKLGVLLAAVLVCAAMSSVALVRRCRLQLILILIVVALATVAAIFWGSRQTSVVARYRPDERLLILSTRRTVQWSNPGQLAPIYFNMQDVPDDTMVIHPDRTTLLLHPRQMLLLRRLGRSQL